jgi:hypothetical protein
VSDALGELRGATLAGALSVDMAIDTRHGGQEGVTHTGALVEQQCATEAGALQGT